MIFLTTTAIDIDEELLNRCLVLTVNEDREQTQAIHRVQREAQTLEGLLRTARARSDPRAASQRAAAAQAVFVVNPYARELTFLDGQTRTRRDHMKYLTLIRSDRAAAPAPAAAEDGRASRQARSSTSRSRSRTSRWPTELAHEVLGRSLDELPPQTRRLLLLIDDDGRGRVRAAEDRAAGLPLLAPRRARMPRAGATRS